MTSLMALEVANEVTKPSAGKYWRLVFIWANDLYKLQTVL